MEFLTNIKLSSDPVLTDGRITVQHYIVNHYRDENSMCNGRNVLFLCGHSLDSRRSVHKTQTLRENKNSYDNLQISKADIIVRCPFVVWKLIPLI